MEIEINTADAGKRREVEERKKKILREKSSNEI